ncbi:hypothetical protein [Klebsiella quasipneumoniae]|uniref:hypothetical protein n=1 Tax=Klebsiella quasipneumoniae TaxID=1463165 RepID=UPI001F4E0266|nr:hypothetical protein [Klebsiella quasipneumoniae]MCH9293725.1 hypothetical protein [Klebsiella quasipneumoniae]
MKKVKWIILNNSFTTSETVKKLMSDPFTEEKGKGFIFDKSRASHFHGRFIEKIISEDRINNLYGNSTAVERIEYRVTSFNFDEQYAPVLLLDNPPRTLKPFAQALVKNLGLGTSLEEIEIDPFTWFSYLNTELTLNIVQLDVSQIQVAEFALAKMQINSTSDLKKYFKDELIHKKMRLDRLTCTIHDQEFSGKLKLFRNGMAQIEARAEKELTKRLFDSLMNIRK